MPAYEQVFLKQKEFYTSGQTKSYEFRKRSLTQLKKTIKNNEKKIMKALKKDLNKSAFEAYSTEIGVLLNEISFVLKNLKAWMKPKKVKTPITHVGSRSYIYSEPYGVSLIIAPWNFPFQLAMAPLVGAIAAGNCAIIKPSEFTPHTSSMIHEIISHNFGSEYLEVIEGGVETNQALLKKPFDYIFFTGSPQVGKIVMEAAAKHLTPVTLELGGKSPCIIHKDAHLQLAAKRITWGKFLNAGQTCIAPDYLYLHKEVKEDFLALLKDEIQSMYGKDPLKNKNYSYIVNEGHFNRLTELLEGEDIYFGGKRKKSKGKMEPTLLTEVSWEDKVMQGEIFGPILPILDYDQLDEVYKGIDNSPKPLALYLFTEDDSIVDEVLSEVRFGGGSINDTVYHFANPYLPFGGVGTSGLGAYHGEKSFESFSHQKGILKQTTDFDIPVRYPNMKAGLQIIRQIFK